MISTEQLVEGLKDRAANEALVASSWLKSTTVNDRETMARPHLDLAISLLDMARLLV